MVRGLATANIRRILSVGQAALNRAYREGEITAVPQILLSLAPEAEARERLLTIDEARALFAGANEPHQFLYLMLAFATAARPAAILELTTFQVDSEARLIRLKRGVPVWEVAGFLGHSSGYKTTERYAKFGPDHLAEAVRAIDGYFADLGLAAVSQRATRAVRVSSVLVPPAMGSQAFDMMVGATGIEPVTPTMST